MSRAISFLTLLSILCAALASRARAAEAPAVPPVRVAVCAFETQNEDPRLRKVDQREFLASLVEERLRGVAYIQVLPRMKAGSLSREGDFTLRGEYLTLVNGRCRVSLRLVGREGAIVATWSDEAVSWRSLLMDSRELDFGEKPNASDRQSSSDRRSLISALAADVTQELLRHYNLRQLAALHGSPDAIAAVLRLDPKQDAYKNGDQVSLIVTPEADCHVVAVQIRAGGTIRLLCPVRGQETTQARANADFVVGGQPLWIRSILPSGEEESRVRIFLTREPLKVAPALGSGSAPADQLRLTQALLEALKALPADAWSDREMSLCILPSAG